MKMHQHAYRIWLFSLVRKHGSLTAAALEARLSPSSLSQAVTQLEELLGVKLFDRGPRGVRSTPEGEALCEEFGEALRALDNFDRSTLVKGHTPKTLRIGAYESIAVELLPRFVPALRATWPSLEVELTIARSRELIDRCRHGELDVVFVADPTHAPNLVVRPYGEDSYGLYVSKSSFDSSSFHVNDFVEPGVLTPAAVKSLVDRLGFGGLRLDDKHHSRSYRRYLRTFDSPFRPMLETDSFEAILALVRGGALAGVLPLRVARRVQDEIVRIDEAPVLKDSDPGLHNLSLACVDTFSKNLFERLLGLAREQVAPAVVRSESNIASI